MTLAVYAGPSGSLAVKTFASTRSPTPAILPLVPREELMETTGAAMPLLSAHSFGLATSPPSLSLGKYIEHTDRWQAAGSNQPFAAQLNQPFIGKFTQHVFQQDAICAPH